MNCIAKESVIMLERYSPIFLILIFVFSFMKTGVSQLCHLNDEFDTQVLDSSWLQYEPNLFTTEVSNGSLKMDINGVACGNNCPWFHAQSAGFIYKKIVGDFEVIALVESVMASGMNMGNDIDNDTQLGGLMARDMNDASENYVFNVVGTRFDISSIETKSTTNNNSGTIEHFPISITRAELRMTREGMEFKMYSRDLGAHDWILRSSFTRPDLPDTLQVGIIAYAFESYPEDLMVMVDYIRFSKIPKENHWIGGDGYWSESDKWNLNIVPDSRHSVVIDNLEEQSIQLLPGEIFECLQLNVLGDSTVLTVEGVLQVLANGCN